MESLENQANIDQQPFSRLRRFNLIMAFLHALQGITMIVLSSDFSLPVTTSFVEFSQTTQKLFTQLQTVFELRVGLLVAGFLFLSALAHLLVSLPGIYEWYVANLKKGANYARWIEYAFSSYAVAQMAKNLGNTGDYEKLMKQAAYYKNLFDAETNHIRPKKEDGTFITDFDPMKAWDGFQEGNAFQFTWYVPHDVAGLMELMGKDEFNRRLETMFENAQKSQFGGGTGEIHSFSGIDKMYNHGNQPCLHDSWLFNYSGQPWQTQKWTRAICDEFYGTEPLRGYGVGQDEDQGQLGSWFVMAALGLFDVQGLTHENPTMQFGSPLFQKVIIQLDPNYYQGKELIIETKNNSKENVYIQSVQQNSEQLDNSWIDFKKLTQGGKIVFEMGDRPNIVWGTSTPPPSMSSNK